jgi:hypothetical protein
MVTGPFHLINGSIRPRNYHGQRTTKFLWFKALGQVHNPCKYYIWCNVWEKNYIYEPLDGAKLTGKCITEYIPYSLPYMHLVFT